VENQESASAPAPTAQEIFGLPRGCQTVLERTMADYVFRVVASKRPEVAAAVEALNGQHATMVTANDDVVELRLDGPVTIGTGYEGVTVRLVRAENGLFALSVSGAGTPPLLFEVADLMVSREGDKFVLASGGPRVRFTPGAGTVNIEAYTAPFLTDAPAMVKAFAPNIVGLFSVTVAARAPEPDQTQTS
jgi:hypothetical protein